jgi:uncharacterized membrane protein YphA (DoxX/SURF4 family)
MYKVNTYYTGPVEVDGKMQRPFSSEPYFKVAPGPLGEKMRKEFGDPDAEIAAKVKAPEQIAPKDFAKLSLAEQAAKCPAAVASELDTAEESARQAYKAAAEKELKAAADAETKEVQAVNEAEAFAAKFPFLSPEGAAKIKATADKARAKAKADADKARAEAQQKISSFEKGGTELVGAAKAAYARWVYGVDARDSKVKSITGDVPLSAPQRIEHLEWLRHKAKDAADRETGGLGNGKGTDVKRVAEFRMDAQTAASDLARDADAYIDELKKDLGWKPGDNDAKPEPRGKKLDRVTMWFLIAVGAMLMAGLLTRVACVLAAGFLVMTYLAHPPFPWYPLPPNTEGNPVFINKNVIEALALLALACFPTGRWLGLDALVLRPLCRYRGECPAPAPAEAPAAAPPTPPSA